MILSNHGEHLEEAFSDILGKIENIRVVCALGAEVCLNRDLICLFSSFLREIISNTSSTVLIVPDAPAFAMEQVGKILTKGATDAGISNYKDINEIVETGKLFNIDLSQLIFEKTVKKAPSEDYDSKDVLNTDQKFFSQDTLSFSTVKSSKETACLHLRKPENLLKRNKNIKKVSTNHYDLDMISDQEFCEEDDSKSKFFDYKVLNDRFFSPDPPVSEPDMLQDPTYTGHPCYLGPLPSPTLANQGFQDLSASARSENRKQLSINTKILCKNCKVYDHHRLDKLMIHYYICKRLNPFARKLVCRVCPSFKCKNPSTFHKHMRSKHWDIVKHCEICEFTTSYDGELKKHVKKFHKRAKDLSSSELSLGDLRDRQDDLNICVKVGNLHGKDSENQKESTNSSVASWRKEMGWGPDDQFTCDYWNFVGKGQCRMEDCHKDNWRIIRHHACALCFRNTGQQEGHPASSCHLFPLPEKDRSGGGHGEGERGPSMAQMGMARGERNRNTL